MLTRSRIIIFLAGAGAGILGYHFWITNTSATRPDPNRELQEHVSQLREENRNLQAKLAAALQPSAPETVNSGAKASQAGALDALHVLADLQRKKLITFTTPLLGRKGEITDAVVQLFGLSDNEKNLLQQKFDQVRSDLADLGRRHAEIGTDADGKVSISIPPFPNEGGKVYDGIVRDLRDVLGDERNRYFTELLADQMDRSFGFFGAAERTYVVGYSDGEQYTLQDQVLQKTTKGGRLGFTNNTRFDSYDALASYVGPIISLLPPNFRQAGKGKQ